MKKTNRMGVGKRIILSALVVALVIGISYLAYYLIRYTFYKGYEKDFKEIVWVEGSDFKALADSDKPESIGDNYVLAAKNDKLKLYYDEKSTNVAVYNVATGQVKYSNPQNLLPDDYDNNVYSSKMNSALICYYYAKPGATQISEMNSYDFCTNLKLEEDAEVQYEVEAIENGIRVNYTIGDMSNESNVPDFISEATFDDIISKLEDFDKENGTKQAKSIKNVYQKSKKKSGFYELNSGITKVAKKKMDKTLENIGWTVDDYAKEMEASGTEYDIPVSFMIPLEYTLVDDKLSVNICTDHIIENGGASLIYLDVLPYFGASYYTYNTGDYACYTYVIDETATEPVAKKVFADFAEVTGTEGIEADVTIDTSLLLDVPFANFSLSTIESSEVEVADADTNEEAADTEEAEVEEVETEVVEEVVNLENWSGVGEYELVLEIGKKYSIEYKYFNAEGLHTGAYDLIVDPEALSAEGYFLVPNGSGSLIHLNSPDCDGVNDYNEKVYGMDDVLFDQEISVQETDSVKLPVYGLSDKDSTMFVIMSRGESLGEIHVQTANNDSCKGSASLTNYNTAYTRYYLRAENKVEMSTTDSFIVWNNDIFPTQLTQLYCFLDENHQGYSGMANYYRDYLVANGDLVQSEATEENNIGLYLDLVGAVEGDDTFLGFTYEAVLSLTTFKQAKEIADAFYGKDINNLVINYQGWMNDGYYHDTVNDISVIAKLGGKKGYKELCEYIESKGGKVFGDMSILKVSYGADDFPYTTESSRLYGTSYVAAFGKTSPVTYSKTAALGYKANLYDVLSPKYISRYVDSALKETDKANVNNISFRDLGTVLYSDLKKTNVINREQSKEIILAQFDKIGESNKGVMLNSALAYTLAYADEIINVPIGDNNYIYVDEEVPFYEMVIHGYINYAGLPINLSSDTTKGDNILECLEYGCAPHFTFTYEPASEMKYTALNNLYSTCYTNWIDEASSIYSDVNSVLSKVTTASIVSHEILDDENLVKKITYSNGVVIYVNYSNNAYVDDDVTILSGSYVVKEVAE